MKSIIQDKEEIIQSFYNDPEAWAEMYLEYQATADKYKRLAYILYDIMLEGRCEVDDLFRKHGMMLN